MSVFSIVDDDALSAGFDYHIQDKVTNIQEISSYEYRAIVKGYDQDGYHVLLNTRIPEQSICTCPAYSSYHLCKHIVALNFCVNDDASKDYEAYRASNYYDEFEYIDEYYEEDEWYEEEWSVCDSDKFFNDPDVEKVNKVLFSSDGPFGRVSNNDTLTPEEFLEIRNNYSYNDIDCSTQLFLDTQKSLLKEHYGKDVVFDRGVDKLLLDERLAIYDDYQWVCDFYLNYPYKVLELTEQISLYLNYLRKCSITLVKPKSNLLITLHKFVKYSNEQLVDQLLEYCHCTNYVDYILQQVSNDFCDKIIDAINQNHYYRTSSIADLFGKMYEKTRNELFKKEQLFYSFFYLNDAIALEQLSHYNDFNQYLQRIKEQTKSTFTLELLYQFLQDDKALYHLAIDTNNDFMIVRNIHFLQKNYKQIIHDLFLSKFYSTVDEEMSRKNYRKACFYVYGISLLDNGLELVQQIIHDLKNSSYTRRTALFDEINQVIQ